MFPQYRFMALLVSMAAAFWLGTACIQQVVVDEKRSTPKSATNTNANATGDENSGAADSSDTAPEQTTSAASTFSGSDKKTDKIPQGYAALTGGRKYAVTMGGAVTPLYLQRLFESQRSSGQL